jgi:hypothetical protein
VRRLTTLLGPVVGGLIVAAGAAPSSATAPGARLRVQAMDLLINALDAKTNLGAIEFGSSSDPATPSADVVFPSEPVGPNAAAMKAALDAKIQADAGGTDYNAAFNTGRAANPGARARSFGSGLSRGEDQARLAKIASDNGREVLPAA